MSERNYYVLCDDNCRFEAMTKEQILAAITQAVEHGEVHDIDAGFITKIKEQNAGRKLKFWVGTQAEYNAIETPETNVMYMITDPTLEEDLQAQIDDLREDVDKLADYVIETGTSSNWEYQKWASGRMTATRHVYWTDITFTEEFVASGVPIGAAITYGPITMPSGLFEAPLMQATCIKSLGYMLAVFSSVTASNFYMRLVRLFSKSEMAEAHFALTLDGRWKE